MKMIIEIELNPASEKLLAPSEFAKMINAYRNWVLKGRTESVVLFSVDSTSTGSISFEE